MAQKALHLGGVLFFCAKNLKLFVALSKYIFFILCICYNWFMSKILCVCLSATIQKTILFDSLNINCVNRSKGYRLDASGKAVNSCRVLNQLEKGCSVALCSLGKKNKALFLELAQKDAMKIIPIEVSGFTRAFPASGWMQPRSSTPAASIRMWKCSAGFRPQPRS